MFNADNTGMIWIPYGEKTMTIGPMLNSFHPIPERHGQTDGRTNGQTDGRTEILYQYRASVF